MSTALAFKCAFCGRSLDDDRISAIWLDELGDPKCDLCHARHNSKERK